MFRHGSVDQLRLARSKHTYPAAKVSSEPLSGFSHIFENHFPYFFNAKFDKFNTTTLHCSKFLNQEIQFYTLRSTAETIKCFAFNKIPLRYLGFLFHLE